MSDAARTGCDAPCARRRSSTAKSCLRVRSDRETAYDDGDAGPGRGRRACGAQRVAPGVHARGLRGAEAEDGTQALAALAQSSPDAVVLDVLMPDVDGLEVCRRMRAAGDRTPVLMLTARETVADRVAGLDAGADDYVVKPFDLDELLARMRALLRRPPTATRRCCGSATSRSTAARARRRAATGASS